MATDRNALRDWLVRLREILNREWIRFVPILATVLVAPASAQSPVTPFTDDAGVPNPRYLRFEADFRACRISNIQDRSTMTRQEWFERYCPLPKMKNNANCMEVEAIVIAI